MWRKQLGQSEEHAKLVEKGDGRLSNRLKTFTSETMKRKSTWDEREVC